MYYKRYELLTVRERLGSPPICGRICIAHLFSFLCCVMFLCFVCLRPVSCVLNVARVSGLSIVDRSVMKRTS